MITLLPHPNFACTAMILDRARLDRQRQNSIDLMGAIRRGESAGHPFVRLWGPWLGALGLYHDVMLRQWLSRGFVCEHDLPRLRLDLSEVQMPDWLGNEGVHSSHRGVLLMQDPEHYGQFGWSDEPTKEYVFP